MSKDENDAETEPNREMISIRGVHVQSPPLEWSPLHGDRSSACIPLAETIPQWAIIYTLIRLTLALGTFINASRVTYICSLSTAGPAKPSEHKSQVKYLRNNSIVCIHLRVLCFVLLFGVSGTAECMLITAEEIETPDVYAVNERHLNPHHTVAH